MAGAVSSRTEAAAIDALGAATEGLSADALSTVARDLGEVAAAFDRFPHLRRVLTETTATAESKGSLIERLLVDKVSADTLRVLRQLMQQHWRGGATMVRTISRLSWTAHFIVAERSGDLDDVEDELFRFGRIVAANPELSLILDDPSTPGEGRADLVGRLLTDRARTLTVALLTGLARHPGREAFSRGVADMVELAAERRDMYVATVTSAVGLTDEQLTRLRAALKHIYGRDVAVHPAVDAALVGGVRIRVGDEVIDGSVAGRFDRIRTALLR